MITQKKMPRNVLTRCIAFFDRIPLESLKTLLGLRILSDRIRRHTFLCQKNCAVTQLSATQQQEVAFWPCCGGDMHAAKRGRPPAPSRQIRLKEPVYNKWQTSSPPSFSYANEKSAFYSGP